MKTAPRCPPLPEEEAPRARLDLLYRVVLPTTRRCLLREPAHSPATRAGWAVAQSLRTRRKGAPNDDAAPIFHRRFDTLFFPRRNGRTRREAGWAEWAKPRSRGRKSAVLPALLRSTRRSFITPVFSPGPCSDAAQLPARPTVRTTSPGEGRRTISTSSVSRVVGDQDAACFALASLAK